TRTAGRGDLRRGTVRRCRPSAGPPAPRPLAVRSCYSWHPQVEELRRATMHEVHEVQPRERLESAWAVRERIDVVAVRLRTRVHDDTRIGQAGQFLRRGNAVIEVADLIDQS